eukprot:jgi/Botrbrau1/15768/Bobra.4_1s0130.2
MGTSGISIDRRSITDLNYEEFAIKYMAANRPVIIQGCARDWLATKDWVNPDSTVNIDFLEQHFGDASVWVTRNDKSGDSYGGSQRQEMALREYSSWWRRKKLGRETNALYLKDWHFAHEFPHYKAYDLPVYFCDDWLNYYYDARQGHSGDEGSREGRLASIVTSDYRFVYLGPAGTWTPLHTDVLKSFSWSTNVCGRYAWFTCLRSHP